ncbi:MAG: KpsF/GutQ family sugar-phosphate isomerase [Parvibaculaceae bacterium]
MSDQHPYLATARHTLSLEIKGLEALSASLADAFIHAVDTMGDATGRVIVTGIGKSGHIGRKIAATLASTGTPSHFVHASEASHGDLGMITRDDVVLALSWSGETAELRDLIDYTKRFSIPLVSMTSGPESALAEAADVALLLPKVEEACPNGLAAPTTSTTMQLALGDALATALLERKGFSPADFKNFHPGGKLGAMLAHVSDIMHQGDELPLTSPDMAMSEAIVVMTRKGLGCLGAVDGDGNLIGLITDGDLRRHMGDDLLSRTVGDIMTRDPKVLPPATLASEALNFLNDKKITSIFIVEGNRPVGLVHIHDFLRAGVI